MSAGYTMAAVETTAESAASSSAGSYWNVPPSASVYSEQKKFMPKGTTQAVELLRFVTAYKKGVEALIDITPYSALIRSAADTDGDLTFFAFIDTWVGNNTPETHNVMSVDPNAGKCFPSTQQREAWGDGGRSGNGWQLDADMVFFPRNGLIDTRPRESITISSGYYGSYAIGAITTHEGTVSDNGNNIMLTEGADFTGTLDAEVYPCPAGGKDVERAFKIGQLTKRVQSEGGESSSVASVVDEVYNQLVGDSMTTLSVSGEGNSGRVEMAYDTNEVTLTPGMPVWYEKDDLEIHGNGSRTGYGDFPGPAIGQVISASNGRATVAINGTCVPGNGTHWLPRLKLERHPGALGLSRKLADSMRGLAMAEKMDENKTTLALLNMNRGKEHGKNHRKPAEEDPLIFHPFLVGMGKNEEYQPLPILGQVDLGFLKKDGDCAPAMLSFLQTKEIYGAGENSSNTTETESQYDPGSALATAERLLQKAGSTTTLTNTLNDGDKVCVLARRANGRVFERSFPMPTFFPAPIQATQPHSGGSFSHKASSGDRALLQFAVTGHGWSGSTEQCGEFCHAVYHININGINAFNVTEWRDDCEKNPVSGQYGTWEIHRNGWCPGSVEPGLYLDVTKWAKNGQNTISVDLSVWSSTENKYEKYTNYNNYLRGADGAVLFVGATMFIYDGDAYDSIKAQRKAFTAAEAALRNGCSHPEALRPPTEVNGAFALMQLGERSQPVAEKSNPSRASGLQAPTAYNHESFASLGESMGSKHNRASNRHTRNRLSFLAQSRRLRTGARYNFEARAPWYQFDEGHEGTQVYAGAKVVPAFKDSLIQINKREIRIKVKKDQLPKEWGHAALHLRLEAPGFRGGTMDNWDRMGSLGMVFDEDAKTTTDSASPVKLHPSMGQKLTRSWKLNRWSAL